MTSLLKMIDLDHAGEPVASKCAPERLIAGDPDFLTWAMDASRDGRVRTGIWQGTPGENRSMKTSSAA